MRYMMITIRVDQAVDTLLVVAITLTNTPVVLLLCCLLAPSALSIVIRIAVAHVLGGEGDVT